MLSESHYNSNVDKQTYKKLAVCSSLYKFRYNISQVNGINIHQNRDLVIIYNDSTTTDLAVTINSSLDSMVKELLFSILRGHGKKVFKIKLSYHNREVSCRFYAHIEYISEMCTNYTVAPSILKILINYCKINNIYHPYYSDNEIPEYINETPLYDHHYQILNNLNIKPYGYQLNNVSWMMSIESNVNSKKHSIDYIDVNDLLCFKNKYIDLYIDADSSILYNTESLWKCDFRLHKFGLKGGVLCDEVGLGKTLSMVSLILSDKKAESRRNQSKLKIKVKPKIGIKKKEDADVKIVLKSKEVTELPTEPKSQHSASLVLCPRRLVNQWVTEINKYTSKIRVVEICTMLQAKKPFSINDCDVVITSFSLLSNKNYISSDTCFKVNDYTWKRVIVDEGHEVLLSSDSRKQADRVLSETIYSIKSSFRWICSGTPLPHGKSSLYSLLVYLSNSGETPNNLLANITPSIYNDLLNLVFHRNTKKNLESIVTVPEPVEQVEYLSFTNTERTIYDSISESDVMRKLQVCTNLSVSETENKIIGDNVLNLNQVTNTMATYYMKNCEDIEEKIERTKIKIVNYEEDRDTKVLEMNDDLKIELSKTPKDKDVISDLKSELTNLKNRYRSRIKLQKEKLETYGSDLDKAQKLLQKFRSLDIDNIKNSTCPVMGYPLQGGKVAIAPDGHYYSSKGIDLLFLGAKKTAFCPFTRKELDINDLLCINMDDNTNEEAIDYERSKWGTKMAKIITTLKQIFDDSSESKVIIFSQWKKMLILMGRALADGNIKHVFCQGNVYMMNKSIGAFKTDPATKVILLSSESCNSGSNLTEASHLFLLDAVSMDIESSIAVETQAIARTCRMGQTKTVKIYRFIMKDTVEETYYKNLTQTKLSSIAAM